MENENNWLTTFKSAWQKSTENGQSNLHALKWTWMMQCFGSLNTLTGVLVYIEACIKPLQSRRFSDRRGTCQKMEPCKICFSPPLMQPLDIGISSTQCLSEVVPGTHRIIFGSILGEHCEFFWHAREPQMVAGNPGSYQEVSKWSKAKNLTTDDQRLQIYTSTKSLNFPSLGPYWVPGVAFDQKPIIASDHSSSHQGFGSIYILRSSLLSSDRRGGWQLLKTNSLKCLKKIPLAHVCSAGQSRARSLAGESRLHWTRCLVLTCTNFRLHLPCHYLKCNATKSLWRAEFFGLTNPEGKCVPRIYLWEKSLMSLILHDSTGFSNSCPIRRFWSGWKRRTMRPSWSSSELGDQRWIGPCSWHHGLQDHYCC